MHIHVRLLSSGGGIFRRRLGIKVIIMRKKKYKVRMCVIRWPVGIYLYVCVYVHGHGHREKGEESREGRMMVGWVRRFWNVMDGRTKKLLHSDDEKKIVVIVWWGKRGRERKYNGNDVDDDDGEGQSWRWPRVEKERERERWRGYTSG